MTKHGGAREGAGRPHLDGSKPGEGEPVEPVTISLTAADRKFLRELGDGNVSAGVRRLIKEAAMTNDYKWTGPGWYASRGEGRNRTLTMKVNMDGWKQREVDQAARQQGLGTAFWYSNENELREAL